MIRLALRVPADRAELVLAELLELAPGGVEEGELTLPDGSRLVEYAVYGAPGELPRLPDVRAAAAGVPVEVSTSEVPDDWHERWKQFHRPVLIEGPGAALHVRPPWEPPCGLEGAHEIAIDPGQAFGTGAHATTHMCLELLLALAAEAGRDAAIDVGDQPVRGAAIDVGAGSGVLAIAAALLGYAPVLALDNERESVEAVRANAAANGVQIDARRFDLRRDRLPGLGSPVVVLANLLRPLLLDLAASMEQPPEHLIASGLLREQADEVADAFARTLNLRERQRHERGEWAALWLAR